MKFIKYICLLTLFATTILLVACDVESMGEPQLRQPRVEVEAEKYYVQITQENMEGIALVYRWLDMPTAAKYVITLNAEGKEEVIGIPNRSILTDNGVRELQFTNKDIMDYLNTFGLLLPGSESTLTITLEAFNTDGAPITSETSKASKTSAIHIILAPDIDLTITN